MRLEAAVADLHQALQIAVGKRNLLLGLTGIWWGWGPVQYLEAQSAWPVHLEVFPSDADFERMALDVVSRYEQEALRWKEASMELGQRIRIAQFVAQDWMAECNGAFTAPIQAMLKALDGETSSLELGIEPDHLDEFLDAHG